MSQRTPDDPTPEGLGNLALSTSGVVIAPSISSVSLPTVTGGAQPMDLGSMSPPLTAASAMPLPALTPTSSNGGTLSFQQPFLMLPHIPPIDQQPANQAQPRKVILPKPLQSATSASSSTLGVQSSVIRRKPARSAPSGPAPIAPAPPAGSQLAAISQSQLLSTLSLLQMGAFLPPKVEATTAQQSAPPLSANAETGAVTGRQRKPCNCSKSMCLKLYCECFANGEFCNNCNCQNCHNSIEHEADRSTAIKACLERNPHAFHPKIQNKRQGDKERRHTKGCHCRRSGCLKNYCECYEARIPCTNLCKCIKCKNYEESPDRQTLLQLATAAEVRTQQQNAAARKHLQPLKAENATPLTSVSASGQRLPYTMLQEEVTTAMCQCWLERAEQASKQDGVSDAVVERAILEEVDMCLRSVILKASQAPQHPIRS